MNARDRKTTETCNGVLVVHMFKAPTTPGVWEDLTTRRLPECDQPGCTGQRDLHQAEIPCRWSWLLAHGKGFNGQPFPRRRCPQCEHIRRAGAPSSLNVEQSG
jgi:hypothetical protein